MTSPPLLWSAASRPKTGHRADENEDAVGANSTAGRFVVADGASEGWASGAWAKHLVGCYAHTPPEPATFADWLADARRTRTEPPAAADQPWYAQAKQAEGAFATLVGVEVRPAKSGSGLRWKAVAVGDSCLLHVRHGAVVESFPLTRPEQFDTTPPLIPSSDKRQAPSRTGWPVRPPPATLCYWRRTPSPPRCWPHRMRWRRSFAGSSRTWSTLPPAGGRS